MTIHIFHFQDGQQCVVFVAFSGGPSQVCFFNTAMFSENMSPTKQILCGCNFESLVFLEKYSPIYIFYIYIRVVDLHMCYICLHLNHAKTLTFSTKRPSSDHRCYIPCLKKEQRLKASNSHHGDFSQSASHGVPLGSLTLRKVDKKLALRYCKMQKVRAKSPTSTVESEWTIEKTPLVFQWILGRK